MQEISHDLERMKGDWSAAIGFRAWNQTPATARDPRPSAVESFRYTKLEKARHSRLVATVLLKSSNNATERQAYVDVLERPRIGRATNSTDLSLQAV